MEEWGDERWDGPWDSGNRECVLPRAGLYHRYSFRDTHTTLDRPSILLWGHDQLLLLSCLFGAAVVGNANPRSQKNKKRNSSHRDLIKLVGFDGFSRTIGNNLGADGDDPSFLGILFPSLAIQFRPFSRQPAQSAPYTDVKRTDFCMLRSCQVRSQQPSPEIPDAHIIRPKPRKPDTRKTR
ncbi:uncharacterized protein FOMMEDRAFT_150046 [Fomitiporia mediterranea MF3/22]|uniref:uncharacterized protein n=1 Tax=Fomitiporia mediterranea (strain MF3/22) TaxID=694068 RepID=UPI0004408950|nr:uncharacterized protein FOMMEDRAFT_150046 [Fomitiporia mediterranea MF3/22]EJD07513.1 hypothetical protein FOMMEDRAFT_150046 [Fomitiporia mediterranea MF3/22]